MKVLINEWQELEMSISGTVSCDINIRESSEMKVKITLSKYKAKELYKKLSKLLKDKPKKKKPKKVVK